MSHQYKVIDGLRDRVSRARKTVEPGLREHTVSSTNGHNTRGLGARRGCSGAVTCFELVQQGISRTDLLDIPRRMSKRLLERKGDTCSLPTDQKAQLRQATPSQISGLCSVGFCLDPCPSFLTPLPSSSRLPFPRQEGPPTPEISRQFFMTAPLQRLQPGSECRWCQTSLLE